MANARRRIDKEKLEAQAKRIDNLHAEFQDDLTVQRNSVMNIRDQVDDLQTTLQAIDLSSGDAHTLARGLRNVIGYSFDRKGRLLFTSFGSDNAAGIPGGNHHNVPDCDLNAMALPDWLQ